MSISDVRNTEYPATHFSPPKKQRHSHSLSALISNANISQVSKVLRLLTQDFQWNGSIKLSWRCSESQAVHPTVFSCLLCKCIFLDVAQRVSHYLAQHNKTPTTIKRMTEAEAVDPLFLILEAERKLREQSFKSPLTA